MINLYSRDDNNGLFQEGLLEDSLKKAEHVAKAADIGVDKIKDTFKDKTKGKYDKAKVVNDEGIQKGNKVLGRINKEISNQTVNTASIVARSKNSVLQFPCYVTQGNRVNELHIISKMFERVYATFVQTVLSQNQILDYNQANNLVFLKQFHTNINEAADVLMNKYYTAIDDMDRMMCESIYHKVKLADNFFVEFKVVPTVDKTLIMENARLCNEPLQGFTYLKEAIEQDAKETQKGNVRTTKKDGNYPERVLTNEELAQLARKFNIKYRVKDKNDPNLDGLAAKVRAGGIMFPDKVIYHGKPININRKVLCRRDRHGNWEYYLAEVQGSTITTDTDKVVDKHFRDAVEAPKFLKDSDIKKVNGMLPYTIEATFRLRTEDGLDHDVKYIIGIKTIMHLISIKDLAGELREIITGNVKSLQKVRYKTGEISFKDYFFNIKGLKADAAKHINYDKRWLNTLKRLGEYEKMNGTLMKKGIKAITGGNVPIPNGTFIISQAEVTKLVNDTGIDLSIVANVKRFAKALFLIGFVIIDESAGTMRVLFPDTDSTWDVQSMNSIDAEVSRTDNSQLMKELNRKINN